MEKMRLAATLVFALAVLVKSIVCTGESAPGIPVDKVYRLTSDSYNGLYYWDIRNGLQPLVGTVTFVVKGNTIIGRGIGSAIHPMYDSKGHVIVIESGVHKRIETKQMGTYGIFGNYYLQTPDRRHESLATSDRRLALPPSQGRPSTSQRSPSTSQRSSSPIELLSASDRRLAPSPNQGSPSTFQWSRSPIQWSASPDGRRERSRSPVRRL